MVQGLIAFTQQLPDQILQRLPKSAEGHIAIELVEFAFDEIAPLPNDGLVDFIDHSGFANAREPCHQHQFRGPLGDPVKGRQQGLDFPFASVEFFGDEEAIAQIPLTQLKGSDRPTLPPLVQAAP